MVRGGAGRFLDSENAHAHNAGASTTPPCRAPAPPSATHAIDSRKGLLSGDFFTAGASGFVSENGLAEAARFHESTRPLEGRMRIPQPSRTAPRGALFTG